MIRKKIAICSHIDLLMISEYDSYFVTGYIFNKINLSTKWKIISFIALNTLFGMTILTSFYLTKVDSC